MRISCDAVLTWYKPDPHYYDHKRLTLGIAQGKNYVSRSIGMALSQQTSMHQFQPQWAHLLALWHRSSFFFFFFGVVAKHLDARVSHPAGRRKRETPGGNALRTGRCAALCGTPWCDEHRPHPGSPRGHAAKIPTKTPFAVGQFAGRLSSSFRQFVHVAFTSLSSIVLLWNLAVFISSRSRVSLLFMVLVHLFCTSFADWGGGLCRPLSSSRSAVSRLGRRFPTPECGIVGLFLCLAFPPI